MPAAPNSHSTKSRKSKPRRGVFTLSITAQDGTIHEIGNLTRGARVTLSARLGNVRRHPSRRATVIDLTLGSVLGFGKLIGGDWPDGRGLREQLERSRGGR